MPRLPRGMYRRGSAFYVRTWEAGRDHRRSLGTDYTMALDRYHKIMAGEEPAEPATTISEMGEQWCDTCVPTRRTGKGIPEARSRFRRHLGRFLGHVAIDRLRPDHIRDYRAWLERQRSRRVKHPGKPRPLLKPWTVKHLLDDAKSFFTWLEEGGYVVRFPFPRGIMPKIPETVPDPCTAEESEKLLALEERYSWTIRLALACFTRWGETTRIQARDLQKDGTIAIVQGKTGRVKRVPLNPEIAAEIRQRVGLLTPFSPTSSGSFNREVTDRVAFRFTFKRLRPNAGCRALESGMRIEVVSVLLGHRSIETTIRHYARLWGQAVRREVERSWTARGN